LFSQQRAGMNQSTLLLYNNVLALPLMAAYLLLATNEVEEVMAYPQVKLKQMRVTSNRSAYLPSLHWL
jgi:hypothetical protein